MKLKHIQINVIIDIIDLSIINFFQEIYIMNVLVLLSECTKHQINEFWTTHTFFLHRESR